MTNELNSYQLGRTLLDWCFENPENKKEPVFIALDKSTAIKFSKEVKRQIFLLEVWLWAKKQGYYSNFIEAILM